jgi:D-alanine-D-alanine ligase
LEEALERPRILILAGGWSREREVSLKSGQAVYEHIPKERFQVEMYDPLMGLEGLFRALEGTDLVINMLHGKRGEDGAMQGLLEIMGKRYLGSRVLGSALAMDKYYSKLIYISAGLKVPRWVLFEDLKDPGPKERLIGLPLPLIVKPVDEGSSFGLALCRDLEEATKALEEGLRSGSKMMAEEYIDGRELTCCVIGNREPMALPVVEIRPKDSPVFDFASKYEPGRALEICPADLDRGLTQKVHEAGILAHKALGLKDLSRTDMILKEGELYILETNTLPGMTPNSLFPQAARAMGWSMSDLLERLIELALKD